MNYKERKDIVKDKKAASQKKAEKHSNSLTYKCTEALSKVVRKATSGLSNFSKKRPQVA